ncbi:MAG: chemotaxis response regulator protein-glutamate methylesterase [Gemmatimonadaceae bacterium]|nr:chemotaxis response regulator protein-glutamate methylesterase [Gemmatimonadaceae bacterium]MDQ3518842.1 chemotaxis response regulator protein-glutamate methylesterase [Gemmatimonadota bacterium]
MIRVLVADDSPTARHLLSEMLKSDPNITVVGEAASGADAVAMAERLAPDVITMDVHMPVMDGIAATREIMRRAPTRIIIVSSRANEEGIEMSLEATRAGALAVLGKPEGPHSARFEEQRSQLISTVRAMSEVKVVRRWGLSRTPPEAHLRYVSAAVSRTPPVRLIAIGSSTGGPAALRDILAALPSQFPVPILIVQHIANGFVQGLANWLASTSALRIKVAEEGEQALAKHVYIAPDDRHLGIGAGMRLKLSAEPKIGQFRPSATHLYESAARTLGTGVLAVILTGMGDDGVAGLRSVRSGGGRVLAQDEASCIVYGMPREAVRAGLVDAVVPLAEMPQRLVDLVA